jgi:hypothetical protein
MSWAADHASRTSRHACQSCRARKARFAHRGGVKADRHHTLCFECFRAERERLRAQGLAQSVAALRPMASGSLSHVTALPAAAAQHRWRMLAHLIRVTRNRDEV